MADERITDAGYDQEDAYFHQKDRDLLARQRAQLGARRAASAPGPMTCPRCGAAMAEVPIELVKVDRCTGCGGVFLDKGELEVLSHARSGGVFKRLFRT